MRAARCCRYTWRRRVWLLASALQLLLLLVQSLSAGAHSTAASASSSSSSSTPSAETERAPKHKHKHHHNCIHEEKVDEFDATVNLRSIVNPQRLLTESGSPDGAATPSSSQQSWILESFLDAVGLSSATIKRELRSSATEAASAFQPIRIAFDLSKLTSDNGFMCVNEGDTVSVDGQSYVCTKDDVLTPAKREFIVSVLLKGIKDYFETTLSVQRVLGNLIVNGIGCSAGATWACCAKSIPPSYRTDGIANADYVLHVTGRPTTGATIAWALPCNIDQYGRPISGHANFGPGKLDPVSPASRDEQIGTGIHEMTHALVFSRNRFYDFRQPLNGPLWGYNNVVAQTKGRGGITVSKIVTPNVVKQVKQHFNCFNWVDAGLELENGDKGSADFSSHWEKRVVMNEYMSATSSYDPVYSAFTLALFEDSGWYQVNYAGAQILPWGYMEGCGVAQSICSEWSDRYVCKDSSQQACTADYTSKGYCNVAAYSASIPAGFQYFQDPMFGGRDAYADYCPFYRAYSNGDCRGIGRMATYVDTDNFMEEVGLQSKCFLSSLSKRSSDSAAMRTTCYRVTGCSSTSLKLSIGGKDVECPLEGGVVTVSGYRGKLQCPVGTRLCQMIQDKCSGSGVLLPDGTCQCNPGHVGSDCSGIACPKSSNGLECSGDARGKCDYSTGVCACTNAYTGLSCSELVCPAATAGKNDTECSGQGTCDRAYGTCACRNGYSGKACECVPGCSATSCGANGSCDCTTGACSCAKGYSGVTCAVTKAPSVVELVEDGKAVKDVVGDKEYKFYKIKLLASSYDVTFVVEYDSSSGLDVDLYGSFEDEFPTSLSAKTSLFKSDLALGTRDAINLCGSLGVFPRGLNDTLRYCPRATSAYLLGTPGYFYLSVLGYKGGAYSLTVETDKCKGVTCSNHGTCGLNYAGICTCDRYWSGDDCSVPKCGPDCQDLGTCSDDSAAASGRATDGGDDGNTAITTDLSNAASSAITALNALRNTSECYGNGVCQVLSDANGKATPTCVCDEAFSFSKPTPTQALCKELVPSIAYIQHFTQPFTVSATLLDLQLSVSAWALYTIQVQDAWELLVVTLQVTSAETDAMLFVRKEKLPSVATTQSATSASYLQFMDSDGWTAGSSTRKIVLSRATSTLSSGLYYVGIYNSAYARAKLAYTLSVNATADCSTPDPSTSTSGVSAYGVCENGGQCSAKSSQVCTCPSGYSGKFCGLHATRATLSPPAGSDTSGVGSTASVDALAYVAFATDASRVLEIGAWSYYSFDVSDVRAKLVQIKLVIENDMDTSTPVLPLLLARGPSDDGFPTLFSESQQDFAAIGARRQEQVVAIPITTACTYATSLKDCYKVAVHNRVYSGSTLRYRLEVRLFGSTTAMYPLPYCGATGDRDNCNSNGKCVLVAGASADADAVPSCQCAAGWLGLRCNSPKSFALPQLWRAINDIAPLCSVCSATFSLARGELKMFRVPESLRDNAGLRLRVNVTGGSSSTSAGGVVPSVYVSEVLPRSIYDFAHISLASASINSSSSALASQVLSLPNASLTGQFWVVVYSDYPTSDTVGISSLSAPDAMSSRLTRRRKLLHSSRALWLLEAAAGSSGSEADGTFELVAEVYALPDGASGKTLLTQKSFLREVVLWLFHTPIGIAVFVFLAAFLLLLVSYCLWRLCHAPENQDKQIKQHFGHNGNGTSSPAGAQQRSATASSPVGVNVTRSTSPAGMTLAPTSGSATAHVQDRDVELGHASGSKLSMAPKPSKATKASKVVEKMRKK